MDFRLYQLTLYPSVDLQGPTEGANPPQAAVVFDSLLLFCSSSFGCLKNETKPVWSGGEMRNSQAAHEL